MNPTEIYTYRPLLKRVYNLSYFSKNNKNKKSGKKLFPSKNKESQEDNKNNYKYRSKYLSNNTTHNFLNNKIKIYEFDAPIISHKDINKKS